MISLRSLTSVAVVAGACISPALVLADPLPPEQLPVIKGLPDALRMNDGSAITSPAQWEARRVEMKKLIVEYEYGHAPEGPFKVEATSVDDVGLENDGVTRHRVAHLIVDPVKRVPIDLHLFTPAEGKTPMPVIVGIGKGCPNIGEINQRGYAFACFAHRNLDPDTEGKDDVGPAQAAYPECDWGSVAIWAWGASRVLDYLLTQPEFDKNRVVVTGHSRTGKAALLAGALDERFAVVVPNGSGCGGASAYRVYSKNSETLALITNKLRFYSWFQKDFGRFAGNETRLPFDQHFLRALVAPRAVLCTEARGDTWANPDGNKAAFEAAQPVFDFLGVPKHNAMHIREGEHDQLAEDFRALLDFADTCFGRP
ncbi:MAG: hypothetical protein K1Y02_03985 [Candidatus Hydrogenedentes bacterium]|nr:hypothetical protein [Candidatus Hydrogenedentota bacterium]